MWRWLLGFGILAMLAGNAVGDAAVAKRLFDEGRVLYEQQKYIEACVLFEKSYQLDPAVGTKLNLAECAERDGKPRAAWLLWISAADEFERDGDRRATFARGRADALAPKLATVIVKLSKPELRGLTVRIAGRDVAPAAEIVDRLDPGAIAIAVEATGREPYSTTVSVAVGGSVTVDVPKLRELAGAVDEPEPAAHGSNGWWIGAAVSGTVTVLSAALVIYAGAKISSIEDELRGLERMPPIDRMSAIELNDEGEAWEQRSYIGGALAVTGAVVTTVLIVKAMRSGRARRTTALRLSPVVAPEQVGALLQLRW